ncbi:MAG: hypothetical protein HQM08_07620 [Candidatus Riflebacteria bacterium]|nr:hypothetical protein [Candidatus Riflebacteria bacterium]
MKGNSVRNFFYLVFSLFFFLFPLATFGYGHYTVYSGVPADVYIDNEYNASISATQSLKLILRGPQSYIIGVRNQETGETYKEQVNVGSNLNEHRTIRAFQNFQGSNNEVMVYSQIPAEVYIDNVFKASVDSTQPMAINLPGPRLYVFEIRAKESKLIFREEVNIDSNSATMQEIRAFSESQSPMSSSQLNSSHQPLQFTTVVPVPTPQGGISREEMASEIQKATTQAKAEALSEEAGRRKRAEQRALTSKGIAHVVGVEANPGLSNSVKNMERIQLLMQALPAFGK